MAKPFVSTVGPLVLVNQQNGLTLIPTSAELTRLHYFDGKFLRAEDLDAEQRYFRRLVEMSNRAGGPGVVNGFDVEVSGDVLTLTGGLAIDPAGRVLMLPEDRTVSVQQLIDQSRNIQKLNQPSALPTIAAFEQCQEVTTAPPTTDAAGRSWYLITIAHAEAMCGEEDVYGKLCEEACISSTDRPWIVEGVVLRAIPFTLPLADSTAVKLSRTHLRSLLASAFFANEATQVDSLISGAGIKSSVWCHGAPALGGNEVALAVLVRDGGNTLFVDEWTARRERMDTPPKQYWQWRMAMRPWSVYMAQILQFQCQLHMLFSKTPLSVNDESDPCTQAGKLVQETQAYLDTLTAFYQTTTKNLASSNSATRERILNNAPILQDGVSKLIDFQKRLNFTAEILKVLPQNRYLIQGGIVELPSAGYLPVVPGTVTVNEQVRKLLGEGVDLRFCIVRPDFVAHALEEAQHMERISLLEGLDDPNNKPKVDILVPDGRIGKERVATGRSYEMHLSILPITFVLMEFLVYTKNAQQYQPYTTFSSNQSQLYSRMINFTDESLIQEWARFEFMGAARSDKTQEGGTKMCFAGMSESVRDTKPNITKKSTTYRLAEIFNPQSGTTSDNAMYIMGNHALDLFNRVRDLLLFDVSATPKGIHAGAWMSMETQQDPFTLAKGGSTPVKAEILISWEVPADIFKQAVSDQNVIIERMYKAMNQPAESMTADSINRDTYVIVGADFTGLFKSEILGMRGNNTDAMTLMGTLTGRLNIRVQIAGLTDVTELNISERVEVKRVPGTDGDVYMVQMSQPSPWHGLILELLVGRKWTSSTESETIGEAILPVITQSQVDATGATNSVASTTKTTRRLYTATQDVNQLVLEPSHPAHVSSISALRLISRAYNNPNFADGPTACLFPPAQPSKDLAVLATQDWVLFHRRREKQCYEDVPAVPVGTRNYALYHIDLTEISDQLSNALLKAMEKNDTKVLSRFKFDFIRMVEFASGVPTMLTPQTQLFASWNQFVDQAKSNAIIGGVIGSRGEAIADGKALALARIEKLADTLGTKVQVDPKAEYIVLPTVPDNFNTGDNDGAIFLATRVELIERVLNTDAVPLKTVVPEVKRSALLVYSQWRRSASGVVTHVNIDPKLASSLDFLNNVPQGSTLTDFISKLGTNHPVQSITLATIGTPDADANTRLKAIVDALHVGIPQDQWVVQKLSPTDKATLTTAGLDYKSIDEVIFLEFDAGA